MSSNSAGRVSTGSSSPSFSLRPGSATRDAEASSVASSNISGGGASHATSAREQLNKYALNLDQKNRMNSYICKDIELFNKSKKISTDSLPLSIHLESLLNDLSERLRAKFYLGGSRRDQVLGYGEVANDTDIYGQSESLLQPLEFEVIGMNMRVDQELDKTWRIEFRNLKIDHRVNFPKEEDLEVARKDLLDQYKKDRDCSENSEDYRNYQEILLKDTSEGILRIRLRELLEAKFNEDNLDESSEEVKTFKKQLREDYKEEAMCRWLEKAYAKFVSKRIKNKTRTSMQPELVEEYFGVTAFKNVNTGKYVVQLKFGRGKNAVDIQFSDQVPSRVFTADAKMIDIKEACVEYTADENLVEDAIREGVAEMGEGILASNDKLPQIYKKLDRGKLPVDEEVVKLYQDLIEKTFDSYRDLKLLKDKIKSSAPEQQLQALFNVAAFDEQVSESIKDSQSKRLAWKEIKKAIRSACKKGSSSIPVGQVLSDYVAKEEKKLSSFYPDFDVATKATMELKRDLDSLVFFDNYRVGLGESFKNKKSHEGRLIRLETSIDSIKHRAAFCVPDYTNYRKFIDGILLDRADELRSLAGKLKDASNTEFSSRRLVDLERYIDAENKKIAHSSEDKTQSSWQHLSYLKKNRNDFMVSLNHPDSEARYENLVWEVMCEERRVFPSKSSIQLAETCATYLSDVSLLDLDILNQVIQDILFNGNSAINQFVKTRPAVEHKEIRNIWWSIKRAAIHQYIKKLEKAGLHAFAAYLQEGDNAKDQYKNQFRNLKLLFMIKLWHAARLGNLSTQLFEKSKSNVEEFIFSVEIKHFNFAFNLMIHSDDSDQTDQERLDEYVGNILKDPGKCLELLQVADRLGMTDVMPVFQPADPTSIEVEINQENPESVSIHVSNEESEVAGPIPTISSITDAAEANAGERKAESLSETREQSEDIGKVEEPGASKKKRKNRRKKKKPTSEVVLSREIASTKIEFEEDSLTKMIRIKVFRKMEGSELREEYSAYLSRYTEGLTDTVKEELRVAKEFYITGEEEKKLVIKDGLVTLSEKSFDGSIKVNDDKKLVLPKGDPACTTILALLDGKKSGEFTAELHYKRVKFDGRIHVEIEKTKKSGGKQRRSQTAQQETNQLLTFRISPKKGVFSHASENPALLGRQMELFDGSDHLGEIRFGNGRQRIVIRKNEKSNKCELLIVHDNRAWPHADASELVVHTKIGLKENPLDSADSLLNATGIVNETEVNKRSFGVRHFRLSQDITLVSPKSGQGSLIPSAAVLPPFNVAGWERVSGSTGPLRYESGLFHVGFTVMSDRTRHEGSRRRYEIVSSYKRTDDNFVVSSMSVIPSSRGGQFQPGNELMVIYAHGSDYLPTVSIATNQLQMTYRSNLSGQGGETRLTNELIVPINIDLGQSLMMDFVKLLRQVNGGSRISKLAFNFTAEALEIPERNLYSMQSHALIGHTVDYDIHVDDLGNITNKADNTGIRIGRLTIQPDDNSGFTLTISADQNSFQAKDAAYPERFMDEPFDFSLTMNTKGGVMHAGGSHAEAFVRHPNVPEMVVFDKQLIGNRLNEDSTLNLELLCTISTLALNRVRQTLASKQISDAHTFMTNADQFFRELPYETSLTEEDKKTKILSDLFFPEQATYAFPASVVTALPYPLSPDHGGTAVANFYSEGGLRRLHAPVRIQANKMASMVHMRVSKSESKAREVALFVPNAQEHRLMAEIVLDGNTLPVEKQEIRIDVTSGFNKIVNLNQQGVNVSWPDQGGGGSREILFKIPDGAEQSSEYDQFTRENGRFACIWTYNGMGSGQYVGDVDVEVTEAGVPKMKIKSTLESNRSFELPGGICYEAVLKGNHIMLTYMDRQDRYSATVPIPANIDEVDAKSHTLRVLYGNSSLSQLMDRYPGVLSSAKAEIETLLTARWYHKACSHLPSAVRAAASLNLGQVEGDLRENQPDPKPLLAYHS